MLRQSRHGLTLFEIRPMQPNQIILVSQRRLNSSLSVHCRTCGHWPKVEPQSLPGRLQTRPVPSLEAVFRCSRCYGRDTCAMPLFASQRRAWRKTGEGWIMPPAAKIDPPPFGGGFLRLHVFMEISRLVRSTSKVSTGRNDLCRNSLERHRGLVKLRLFILAFHSLTFRFCFHALNRPRY